MTEVVRFMASEGVSVLVEADEETFGVEPASRGADGVLQAGKRLEEALLTARATVASAVTAMGGLGFGQLSLEFGLKLSAEAGAVIAKTAGEAHLTITASWGRDNQEPARLRPQDDHDPG
jgi:Trypsin-co-occurring domain 1